MFIRDNFTVGFIQVQFLFPSGIIKDGHIDLETYNELVKTQDFDYNKDLLVFKETDGDFDVIKRYDYSDEDISNYYE